MDQPHPPNIQFPTADLERLSFCNADPAALNEWVSALPMANTAESAGRLIQATDEIARLRCSFRERLALLEVIRPTLHYLCARLDRLALGPTGDASDQALTAQRLQNQSCAGYKAAIMDSLQHIDDKTVQRDQLPLAIHRALSDLSRSMLRSLQAYAPPADNLWRELNQLYLLAERLALVNQKVRDTENHGNNSTSISDAYLRSVLLAAGKPNQLRHQQLAQVFNALELWTSRIFVEDGHGDSVLFIDLEGERGPQYTKLQASAVAPRSVRTDILTYEIEAYLKEIDSGIPIPEFIGHDLLAHLIDAWSTLRDRSFRRMPSSQSIKVCVGLRATHYFLSGGVSFSEQLSDANAVLKREINPFISQIQDAAGSAKSDVWDDHKKIPENPGVNAEQIFAKSTPVEEDPQTITAYATQAIDTSPGGYCVTWQDRPPANLQVGELLALREESDPRWCIATVRWIRQDASGTSTGFELLSPKAIPVAVRVVQTKGGPTDYARALLLPELKAIDQPALLITPRVPFQAGQKVQVQRQNIQTTAALGEMVLGTESFNQFTFRMLDGYLENLQIDLNMGALTQTTGDEQPTNNS